MLISGGVGRQQKGNGWHDGIQDEMDRSIRYRKDKGMSSYALEGVRLFRTRRNNGVRKSYLCGRAQGDGRKIHMGKRGDGRKITYREARKQDCHQMA